MDIDARRSDSDDDIYFERLMAELRRKDHIPLLGYRDLCSTKEEDYLVEKIIVENELNMVFGPPGVGKTFLALDMALSVASGRPFLGLPVKQGRVVYIYSEGGAAARKRIEAWLKAHGLEDELIEGNIHIIPKSLPLLDEYRVRALIDNIKRVDILPSLIVVDTLARSFTGGNPDTAADMSRYIAACDEIQASLDCALLLIHHSTKSNSRVESGSHMLRGASASIYHLDRKRGSKKELKLRCSKIKDAESEDLNFNLALETIQLEPDENGKERSSCVLRPGSATNGPHGLTPNQSDVFSALAQTTPQGLSVKELTVTTGLGGSSIHKALEKLLELEKASRTGSGKATRYSANTSSHPDDPSSKESP